MEVAGPAQGEINYPGTQRFESEFVREYKNSQRAADVKGVEHDWFARQQVDRGDFIAPNHLGGQPGAGVDTLPET